MPGQLSPLTREEARKYEILMQKSVRILREEAKRAKLCAGAKTKSELAYSMVKEKRPRRKFSDTSEDPLPSPESKSEDPDSLNRGSGNPYPSLDGVASLPKQQPFPPKFSPAQLLAGADTRVNLIQNQLLEDESTRSGSSYRPGKDRLKENAEKVMVYVPRVQHNSGETHRDRSTVTDHRQNHISIHELSHSYPGYILHRIPLDSITPSRVPKRSRDDEAEPMPRFYQPCVYDKRLTYDSSEPANTGRGRHDYVTERQGGWSHSTRRLEQSVPPCEVYDAALPSPVVYRPSPAFSTQPQSRYDRSATLAPIQDCSATSRGFFSYPAPSYEKDVSEPVDGPQSLPTELSEEDRTLPPIREVLSFLSWSDHSQAMPLPRTQDRCRLFGPG